MSKQQAMVMLRPFQDTEVMKLVKEYQHLYQKVQLLKELARINTRLLLMHVTGGPEVKEELDKVQMLIHALMTGKQIYSLRVVDTEGNDAMRKLQEEDAEGYEVEKDGEEDESDSRLDWGLNESAVKEEEEEETTLPSSNDELSTPRTDDNSPLHSHRDNCAEKQTATNVQPLRDVDNGQARTTDNKFTCKVCGKSYKHSSSFHEHKLTHLGKSYKCSLCSKEFKTRKRLGVHQRFHEKKKEKSKTSRSSKASTNSKSIEVVNNNSVDEHNANPLRNEGRLRVRRKYVRRKGVDKSIDTIKKVSSNQVDDGIVEKESLIADCLSDAWRSNGKDRLCDTNLEHETADSNEDLLSCQVMKYKQKNDSIDQNEMQIEIVYTCKVCLKQFTTQKRLRDHFRSHDKVILQSIQSESTLCSICGLDLENRCKLLEHLKEHDELQKNEPQKCADCGKEFPSAKHLKSHLKRAHGVRDKSFMCEICGRTFFNRSKMMYHRKLAHIAEPKACHICGKNITVGNLSRHVKTHSGEKPYKCPECPKAFTTNSDRNIHQMKHHLPVKYYCTFCNKGFPTTHFLRLHEKNHLKKNSAEKKGTPVVEKEFSCGVCLRQYSDNISFALHILSFHSRELDRCPLCKDSNIFTSFLDFESHLKNIHLTEKPFPCPICGESFHTMRRLYAHKALHGDNDTLSCQDCGKSFKTVAGLKAHQVTKHSANPVSYRCDICGKHFITKLNLGRHRLLHSGLKPYKCLVCGVVFSTKGVLKLHSWTHSKVKRYQCRSCEKGFNDKRNYTSHLKKFHPEDEMLPSVW